MKLNDLLKYNDITIQCHDNPDADAIASGYGLYCFFHAMGKNVKLIYSGNNIIQKANLTLMIEKLNIPIGYFSPTEVSEHKIKGLLITVDCQYGAGNVTKIEADTIAIIDHHQIEINNIDLSLIMPGIGSCSTIIWNMLTEENFNISDDLGTALYYGLLTDTNQFTEMHTPLDRDAQDGISFNNSFISLFCNSNISLRELEIAGIAMLRYSFNEDYNFAVIKAQPCDPNILGLISDFLLQVHEIFTCVVYNEVPGGFKLSVRSCVREVNAGELASFLTQDLGSGGGHYQKAGGFISKKLFDEKYTSLHSEAYFNNRMVEYFNNYDLVYANEYEADIESMKCYRKKNIPVGYVNAYEVLPVGTPITIRTLEGDIDMQIEEDLIIMIGIKGEVYPNRIEKFKRSYKPLPDKYIYNKYVINNDYEPVIKDRNTGEIKPLIDYAKVCVTTGEVQIYAKPIEKDVKVFTSWDQEKYMKGRIGDYLAVRTDDLHDVYIVEQNIFQRTYEQL